MKLIVCIYWGLFINVVVLILNFGRLEGHLFKGALIRRGHLFEGGGFNSKIYGIHNNANLN